LAVVALLLAGAPLPGAGPPGNKLPVPDPPAQAQALAHVQDSFKLKYSTATTAETQKALAQELLQRAQQAPGDSTAQFVLLKEAERLAIKAKNAELALRSIAERGARFAVDVLESKVKAVTAIAKPPWPSQERAALVGAIRAVMEESAARDNYDAAGELGALALEIARKSKDLAPAKQIAARTKELSGLKQFYAEVQNATAALEKDPLDPGANLTVGKYRCFVRGQWNRGISMLALGGNAMLKQLAVQQLKGVNDAAAQRALGDAWWQLADPEEGVVKRNLQGQAATWYRRAVPRLTGSAKEDVETRLKTLPQPQNVKVAEINNRSAPAGGEKTPSAAAARKPVIYPGVGIDTVRFGDGGDRVRALFGEPDRVRNHSKGAATLDYLTSRGVEFFVHGDREIVTEIHCRQKFGGATVQGIGMRDSLDRVLQVSEGALKTVELTRDELTHIRAGGDRILYKEMVDGKARSLKFVDSKRGISYWMNPGTGVYSIIVYPAR
jgi:hypothetical protein